MRVYMYVYIYIYIVMYIHRWLYNGDFRFMESPKVSAFLGNPYVKAYCFWWSLLGPLLGTSRCELLSKLLKGGYIRGHIGGYDVQTMPHMGSGEVICRMILTCGLRAHLLKTRHGAFQKQGVLLSFYWCPYNYRTPLNGVPYKVPAF